MLIKNLSSEWFRQNTIYIQLSMSPSCRHQSCWSLIRHFWWWGIKAHWIKFFPFISLGLTVSHFFTAVALRKAMRDTVDVGDHPYQASKVILAFSYNFTFLGSSNLTHVSIYRFKKKSLLWRQVPPKGRQSKRRKPLSKTK